MAVGKNKLGSPDRLSFDRKLVDLISELTDCGMVWPLKSVLDQWGRETVARVIADGFAVVRRRRDAQADEGLDDANFLPTEQALVLLHEPGTADEYLIAAGPWAAVCLEDEPNLIFGYAADDPEARAELNRRHAERRKTWDDQRAAD